MDEASLGSCALLVECKSIGTAELICLDENAKLVSTFNQHSPAHFSFTHFVRISVKSCPSA